MAHNIDLDITQASIYVGTYAKYNNGSLFGEWLTLCDYTDAEEFYNACRELHEDEEDPEFMFQDYENIPESLVSESWLSDKFFEVRDALLDMDGDLSAPFLVWCSNGNHDLSKEDVNNLINAFEEDYAGEYDSEEDFAREVIREQYELDDFTQQYFDYAAYAHDLFCGDYWFESGYVFYNS